MTGKSGATSNGGMASAHDPTGTSFGHDSGRHVILTDGQPATCGTGHRGTR